MILYCAGSSGLVVLVPNLHPNYFTLVLFKPVRSILKVIRRLWIVESISTYNYSVLVPGQHKCLKCGAVQRSISNLDRGRMSSLAEFQVSSADRAVQLLTAGGMTHTVHMYIHTPYCYLQKESLGP